MLYDTIREQVDLVIAEAKNAAADGSINAAEVFSLCVTAAGGFVKIAESAGGTGAERKEAVLQAAERLYHEVIAPLDIPGIPNWLEPAVDQAVGMNLRVFLSGVIDGLVRVLNKEGVLRPATA